MRMAILMSFTSVISVGSTLGSRGYFSLSIHVLIVRGEVTSTRREAPREKNK